MFDVAPVLSDNDLKLDRRFRNFPLKEALIHVISIVALHTGRF